MSAATATLKSGDRDAQHRRFVGYRVTVLLPKKFSAHYVEPTREDADKIVAFWRARPRGGRYTFRITRVWRKEHRWRRALRELLQDAHWLRDVANAGVGPSDAMIRAKAMLEGRE